MRRATAQLSVMAASGRHLGLADRASEGERCDGVKCTTADREPESCIRRIHHRNCVLSANGNLRNRAQQGAHIAPCHLPSTAPHRASSAGWPTTTQHSLPPAAILRTCTSHPCRQHCKGPQLTPISPLHRHREHHRLLHDPEPILTKPEHHPSSDPSPPLGSRSLGSTRLWLCLPSRAAGYCTIIIAEPL